MDSFQQSELMISRRNLDSLRRHSAWSNVPIHLGTNEKEGEGGGKELDLFHDDLDGGTAFSRIPGASSMRDKAIINDIEPFNSSTIRTAEAAEYFSEGETETRE